MITTALIVDGVQIPVEFLDVIFIGTPINWAIDILTGLTFYIWFKSCGVNFNSKTTLTFGASLFIKLIPFLDMLPAWTFLVVRTIILTRAEEKLARVTPKKSLPRKIAPRKGVNSGVE